MESWTNTFDAFEFGNDCVQPNPDTDEIFGSEDCLYMNIYVPVNCSALNSRTKLPVVNYIFGGQFAFGSSKFYGPDFLLETNVIIVCFYLEYSVFNDLLKFGLFIGNCQL